MQVKFLHAAICAIFVVEATNSCDDVKFKNANLCEEGICYLSKLFEVSPKLRQFEGGFGTLPIQIIKVSR